jgi:HEAT repeat protein
VRDTSQALEDVIRHAEDLQGEIFSVVTELAGSGDVSLVPRIKGALAAFLAGRNFYGRDLMAQILAGVLGVDAFPAVLGAWAVDIGDDRDSVSAMVWQLIESDRAGSLITIRQFAVEPDLTRRRAGVWAMGHAIGPECIDDGDFELIAAAGRDPDGELRATALGALSSLKDDDRACALMTDALRDPYPGVRVSALAGLGYSGRVSAVPAIADMATDPDARVRMFVAVALGDLRDAAGVPAVLTLLDDRDSMVRSEAVKAVGAIGGRQAITVLVDLSHSPDPQVRIGVVGALAANATAETLHHVRRLAGDPDATVRASTVAALGWSGLGDGGPIVAKRADDPDPTVRLRVAVAIDRLEWPGADAILRQFAEDPDPGVRRVAARMIELRASRTTKTSVQSVRGV